jgi:hypothetical protein
VPRRWSWWCACGIIVYPGYVPYTISLSPTLGLENQEVGLSISWGQDGRGERDLSLGMWRTSMCLGTGP